MIDNKDITIAILAGGRSQRMAGNDKGLILLNNKPLISYIIDTFSGATQNLLINANRNQQKYQKYTTQPIVIDELDGFQGPLAGIAACMKVIKTEYLLILPCDCPFVGVELLSRFLANMRSQDDIVIASDGKYLQPTFALIRVSLLPDLLNYLSSGERKLANWYKNHQKIVVDFSDKTHFFENLNTPKDFAFFTKPTSV